MSPASGGNALIRSRIVLAAGGALVSGALLGCGTGSAHTGTGGTAGTLTIPFVDSLTGPLGVVGTQSEKSVLLAVREINDAGGVLGKQVALDEEDDTSDPMTGAALASMFVGQKQDLIYGPVGSSVVLSMLPTTVPSQCFVFGPGCSSPVFTTYATNGWWARTTPTQVAPGHAMAQIAVADGNMKFGLLAVQNSAEQARADAFVERVTALGATVDRIDYPDNAPADYDYPGALGTLFAAKPDAMALAAYTTDGMRFLNTWKAQGGFSGHWYLSDDLMTSDTVTALGATTVEGMKAAVFARPADQRWTHFHDLFAATYNGEEPGIRTAESYDGFYLVALAMIRANSTHAADWRQYLREVADPPGEVVGPGDFAHAAALVRAGTDVNYEGASGSVDLDDNGDVPGAPIQIMAFQNGAVSSLGYYMGN